MQKKKKVLRRKVETEKLRLRGNKNRWGECDAQTNRKRPLCFIITRRSKLVSQGPCLPFSLWLVMRHSCLVVGPAGRRGLDCCRLLEQAKCGKADWIVRTGQRLLVMKRSQSWLLWFRTVFTARLNVQSESSDLFFMFSLAASVTAVNVAGFWVFLEQI